MPHTLHLFLFHGEYMESLRKDAAVRLAGGPNALDHAEDPTGHITFPEVMIDAEGRPATRSASAVSPWRRTQAIEVWTLTAVELRMTK